MRRRESATVALPLHAIRQRGSPTNTYQRLLEMAEGDFAAFGYSGASLDRIARRTGIRKGSLFHYFRSKRQLFEAVIRRIFTAAAEIWRQAGAVEDPVERLTTTVGELHDLIARNPNYSRILLHRVLEDPAQVRNTSRIWIKPLVEQSAEFIRWGGKHGVFRKVQDPADSALSILAMIVFFYAFAPVVEACTGSDIFGPRAIAARRGEVIARVCAMLLPRPANRAAARAAGARPRGAKGGPRAGALDAQP